MTVSSDTPSESTPPGAATPPAPASPPRPPAPVWPVIREAAVDLYAWLMRPRVRLTLAGVLLLLIGALIANNTMWTLPLVIVGALMVAVAWIGHRLEGRFAVEWGEAGTRLAFNTTIKPPQPTTETPAVSAGSGAAPAPELTLSTDDVIDGEAHTVEINVSELKALITAAEAAEAAAVGAAEAAAAAEASATSPAESGEAEVRDIRIRRLVDDGAPGPRAAG